MFVLGTYVCGPAARIGRVKEALHRCNKLHERIQCFAAGQICTLRCYSCPAERNGQEVFEIAGAHLRGVHARR
jgi:hypothetical protein